jgi:hypothetical protein
MTTTPITGETWGDEIEPVKAYLAEEAKQPLSALKAKLENSRRTLLAAVEGVSEAQGQFRAGSGDSEEDWGIAEALRHIASVEAIMADRIRGLGTGQPATLKATYPGFMEDVATRSIRQLEVELEQSRAALFKAIDEIDGHERLDTVDAHRRFGELNCRGWLAMHALHEQDHARQVGKIKAHPDYPRQ